MREQWNELKETIIELRDNNGTATQQEACQFLANYMNVLEAQAEQIKGKSLDEITEAHEQIGYERGYRDGYAQAIEDPIKVVGLNTWAGSRITELQTADVVELEGSKVSKYLSHTTTGNPTADVVEVVRCKDCKHHGDDHFCCYPWCTTPEEFCSRGERKDPSKVS